MTPSALSAALEADTDHVACFERDGTEHRWSALIAAASSVCARVTTLNGQRWALDLDNTFEFAAALLGCLAADRTAVLVAASMLERDAASLSIDGVIDSGHARVLTKERIVWRQLSATGDYITQIASGAKIVLYTSGSTGTPKEITRWVRNLEAEIAVFESLWGNDLGPSSFYSTVSHRHVYGVLFRVLWPLLRRRPFATFDFEYPPQLTGRSRDANVLISSPALLKRVGHLPDHSANWRAIFSSGGLLQHDAAAETQRVLGTCPIEVLGSTETSGVAWRRQSGPNTTLWKAMPTVEIRCSADDFLEVRSPFTGQSDWLRMGDMVRMAGGDTFELLGRGDHLAKIEDKRVSLAQIEQSLLDTPWIDDVAAVALADGSRQYVGVLLQLSDAGTAKLERVGRRAFNELLRTALRARIEPIALPRRFRYVDAIPVDAQGKRRQAELTALFRTR